MGQTKLNVLETNKKMFSYILVDPIQILNFIPINEITRNQKQAKTRYQKLGFIVLSSIKMNLVFYEMGDVSM